MSDFTRASRPLRLLLPSLLVLAVACSPAPPGRRALTGQKAIPQAGRQFRGDQSFRFEPAQTTCVANEASSNATIECYNTATHEAYYCEDRLPCRSEPYRTPIRADVAARPGDTFSVWDGAVICNVTAATIVCHGPPPSRTMFEIAASGLRKLDSSLVPPNKGGERAPDATDVDRQPTRILQFTVPLNQLVGDYAREHPGANCQPSDDGPVCAIFHPSSSDCVFGVSCEFVAATSFQGVGEGNAWIDRVSVSLGEATYENIYETVRRAGVSPLTSALSLPQPATGTASGTRTCFPFEKGTIWFRHVALVTPAGAAHLYVAGVRSPSPMTNPTIDDQC